MHPNQKTTKLGTTRKFEIVRPEGFPKGRRGLAFVTEVPTNTILVIRADAPTGMWRIDKHSFGCLWESYPGLECSYRTPEKAAEAIVARFQDFSK